MKKILISLLVTALLLTSLVPAFAADYDKATVKAVQQALNDAGFNCGTPDGSAGKKTHAAIKAYREANGLTASEEIDEELLNAMGITEEISENADVEDTENVEQTVPESSVDSSTVETTPLDLYTAFRTWLIASAAIYNDAEDRKNNGEDADTVNSERDKALEELGEFDFMEGKSPSNEADYTSQLQKMSEGVVVWHDAFETGIVDFEEFAVGEISNGGASSDALYSSAIVAYELAYAIDNYYGNKDSNITNDDSINYWRNLDYYRSGNEADIDGKISFVDYLSLTVELTDKITSDYPELLDGTSKYNNGLSISESLKADAKYVFQNT